MCKESPILRSWEITFTSRLVNMSQASRLNSWQGKEDVSIAWPIQPIYLFNLTVIIWGISAGPNYPQLPVAYCLSLSSAGYRLVHTFVELEGKEEKEGRDSSASFSPSHLPLSLLTGMTTSAKYSCGLIQAPVRWNWANPAHLAQDAEQQLDLTAGVSRSNLSGPDFYKPLSFVY